MRTRLSDEQLALAEMLFLYDDECQITDLSDRGQLYDFIANMAVAYPDNELISVIKNIVYFSSDYCPDEAKIMIKRVKDLIL